MTEASRIAYRIGYYLERAVKKALENAGFNVFRCAGSKPVDLVVVKSYGERIDTLLVECKVSDAIDPAKVSEELYSTYKIPSVTVVKRYNTMWEWALTYNATILKEATVEGLRRALGNTYSINKYIGSQQHV